MYVVEPTIINPRDNLNLSRLEICFIQKKKKKKKRLKIQLDLFNILFIFLD